MLLVALLQLLLLTRCTSPLLLGLQFSFSLPFALRLFAANLTASVHACRTKTFRQLLFIFGELQIAVISCGATFRLAFCPITASARLARRICAFRRFTVSASENAASYILLLVVPLAVIEVFYDSFFFADVAFVPICFTVSASENVASYMSLLVTSLAVCEVFYGSFLFAHVTCPCLGAIYAPKCATVCVSRLMVPLLLHEISC